ncbi:hypothetical protein AcV7_007263 [Taiwanofungus camphoratus]|nr:hypothetical protein AcV7_007263 [Antrodia cinnamomea]
MNGRGAIGISRSITESGHTKFFGAAANAWYLLQNEEGDDETVEHSEIQLPSDIPWLSYTFPFSSSVNDTIAGVRVSLIELLPEVLEARRLAALYFRHAAWMYTPVPEAEFYDNIFTRFYGHPVTPMLDQDPMDSHKLAILYLVLAMGMLLDLDKPPLSSEATRYYQLGRAALSLDSILEHQSIPAIQALILMCHFMFLSFVEGPRWALMGLAVKLALTLGLHRDSGKWNLNPEETFRRRTLFYELFVYDSWQSLTFGRPPSLSTAFIDCQIAQEATKNEQGEEEMSFATWKHRFASRCLSIVHDQVFGARMPNYRTVQELHKKVHDWYMPPSLRVPGFGGNKMEMGQPPAPLELTMQRYIALSIKEISIFYMHRGFFASAIQDHPDDPLGSKYGQSVLAAYNSACSFIGLIKSLYSTQPALTERMWFLFTHVFSCAIVLGSITTKSPKMALAPSALSHLDSAYSLFEGVSHNPRAQKVLPVLRKLKGRAMMAMSETQSGSPGSSVSPTSPHDQATKEDEELAALRGKTRLVARSSPSLPSSPQGSNSQPGSSPSPRELPDQSFSHSPTDAGPHMPHMPHIQPPPMDLPQWQGYGHSQDVFGYPPYPDMAGQWHQSAIDYSHMRQNHLQYSIVQHNLSQQAMDQSSMPMDFTPAQYAAYTTADPMSSSYMPGNGYSDAQTQQTRPDPEAWVNLFAQFNQA